MNKQDEMVKQFTNLGWEERYQLIIKKGRELDPLPENEKLEDLKVKGCQSQVWLKAKLGEDGKVYFKADSDALIVKGLIAMLLTIYSGETPERILAIQPDFVGLIGLDTHLSPSRANGLFAMIKQIKFYAFAYENMRKSVQKNTTES